MSIETDQRVVKKWLALQQSCVKRGIKFDLPLQSLINLYKAKRCYYTGLPFIHKPDHMYMLTIDRIDNEKGYEKGNVVACTKRINHMKGDMTIRELRQLANKCLS